MERVHQVGERVKGDYFGQPYVGVVTSDSRPHTMNSSYMHFIDLEQPITVYGEPRKSIIVSIWRAGRDAETPQSIEAA